MHVGIYYAQHFGLKPGIERTAEQMALLTNDSIGLVEKEITVADGLDGSGKLSSNNNIDLNLSGDFYSSGVMTAQ